MADKPTATRRPLRQAVLDCETRWFEEALQAAKDGEAVQMTAAGQMLLAGYGCEADVVEGKRWLAEAAQRGGGAGNDALLAFSTAGLSLGSTELRGLSVQHSQPATAREGRTPALMTPNHSHVSR